MSQAGKGDRRRPEDAEAYREGWERTFGSGAPGPDPTISEETAERILETVDPRRRRERLEREYGEK